MIFLRPLAPVFFSRAFFAMLLIASSSISKSTPSSSNSFAYCLTRAFFGSVMILTRASSSSSSSVTMDGSLPMNSGIRPNFKRSSDCTSLRTSSFSGILPDVSELKPITFSPTLLLMIFSSPSNAPPQMNITSFVSNCMNSCWGCFLPPCGGTFATVPSSILSRACCTPSPLTSRVIDGFSLLLAILSISST